MTAIGGSVEQKKHAKQRASGIDAISQGVPASFDRVIAARSRTPRLTNRDQRPATGDHALPAAREVRDLCRLARVLAEKCEISEAIELLEEALSQAEEHGEPDLILEVLVQKLKLHADAGQTDRLQEVETRGWQLKAELEARGQAVSPLFWYCLGAVERVRDRPMEAQKAFHQFLRAMRVLPQCVTELASESRSLWVARGWVMLATVLNRRGRVRRSELLVNGLIRATSEIRPAFRGISGTLSLLAALHCERKGEFSRSLDFLRQAQENFLAERNWYAHLSVLYGFARLARLMRHFHQAELYLSQLESVCTSSELAAFRAEVERERGRLSEQEVDLRIDARRCRLYTKEGADVALGKQFLLLHLLKKLWEAHRRLGQDGERGLSKRELIEQVWGERYRPDVHDNKLYYNINRLRKLIEPDTKTPRYLESWREGYRLAPGLRVEYLEAPLEDGSGDVAQS